MAPGRRPSRPLTATACALGLAAGAACEPGGADSEAPQPPRASLAQVELAEHPDNLTLANYYCRDVMTAVLCDLAFDEPPPAKSTLKFSFETVFGLANPNSFSVPMVELLLAFKVFEGERAAELGAICVSFCDPAAEDCAAPSAEACQAPDETVRSLDDFVPTVDDLVRIATDVATDVADGTLDDNLKFRVIPGRSFQRCRPAGTSCEPCDGQAAPAGADADAGSDAAAALAPEVICCDGADPVTLAVGCHLALNEAGESCERCDGQVESHVRFDLGVDAITGILGEVATDAFDAVENGELPSFDIPYSVEGTLFFDVPVLGRFALAFGPFAAVWSLD